jgi:aspartyl-tRNA(Asn)/glutamyl-tRNA(Gln) amidotransferase subunit A
MDKEVEAGVRAAIAKLGELGAEIIEVSLPHTKYAIAAYYLCATAEASSNLARYDGAHYGYRAERAENIIDMFSRTRAEGFGNEVKRRIMLGTYALSAGYYDAYYLKSLRVRTLIKRDFEKAFESVDAIITPTSPTAAFRVGEKTEDPLQMYLSDIFTISVNLAGVPAIAIPCGFTSNNLPIGLQLIAPNFQEGRLISIAHAYEQSVNFHTLKPHLI